MDKDQHLISKHEQKRKYLRFQPDPLDYALLDPSSEGDFHPKYVALIFQEAFGGCGLTLHFEESLRTDLTPGFTVRVKIGKLLPIPAEVVWSKVIDDEIVRAGFKFLE